MMKILVTCDSFKGTLTSIEVNNQIKKKLLDYDSNLIVETINLSDGGEGFLSLIESNKPSIACQKIQWKNQFDEKVEIEYLYDQTNVYLESASVLSIAYNNQKKYSLLDLTSKNLGQLISHLYQTQKLKNFFIGVGGTGVSDYGIGLSSQLGYRFYDANNLELKAEIKSLSQIVKVELDEKFSDLSLNFVSDIESAAYGDNGPALMFARQKGASNAEINYLETAILNFASRNNFQFKLEQKYVGAGGGLGLFVSLLKDVNFSSGSKFALEISGFNQKVIDVDLVITGEGKFDQQSLVGKIVGTILTKTQELKKKTALIVGYNDLKHYEHLDLVFPLIHNQNKFSLDYHQNLQKLNQAIEKLILNLF